MTATGPRLSAGLKALDQRPGTGAIERYFSCCLSAGLGNRAESVSRSDNDVKIAHELEAMIDGQGL